MSRGAEKNFREFMIRLADQAPTVDTAYCERLIAKAILFRATEKIITAQGFQGFRANIVTYTIARLAHDTGQRIDLDRIWREQKLTLGLTNAIDDLSRRVRSRNRESSSHSERYRMGQAPRMLGQGARNPLGDPRPLRAN